MDESCPPPKLVYKVTNIPHNPLFIGVLVAPSWIRRITLFLMVFKSPLNSPPSLNHESFIPISPPRSTKYKSLSYNFYTKTPSYFAHFPQLSPNFCLI